MSPVPRVLGTGGAVCPVRVRGLGVKNANHEHDVEDEADADAAHKGGKVRHVCFADARALQTKETAVKNEHCDSSEAVSPKRPKRLSGAARTVQGQVWSNSSMTRPQSRSKVDRGGRYVCAWSDHRHPT